MTGIMCPLCARRTERIHTPGVFVKRMIDVGTAKKRIEFRNTRPRPAA